MSREFRSRPPFRLVCLAALGLLAGSLAHAQQNNPANEASQSTNVPVPNGPKSVSVEATVPSNVGATADTKVEIKIADASGKSVSKIVLKLKTNADGSIDPNGGWEVFFAIGDGSLQPTNTVLPAGQTISFSTVLTNDGVMVRFGPPGEGSLFASQPSMPPGFKLNVPSLNVVVDQAGFPPGAGFSTSTPKVNTNTPDSGSNNSSNNQQDLTFPFKPGGSPP